MRLTWLERPLLALAAMLLPASLLHAALQNPADPPGQPSLAGQMLIAAPGLLDPRFDHTVILMVRHNATDGALGIVINRPIGEQSLKSVLAAIGEKDDGATGNLRIYYGGPVQSEIGFVIHSTDYKRDQTISIGDFAAMTSSREIMRDIASGHGPQKTLVAFGYAGWSPGQLEGELALHGWFTAAGDAKLVFDIDRDKVWDEAMMHRTQNL
jgi:putative transcriptional regulator